MQTEPESKVHTIVKLSRCSSCIDKVDESLNSAHDLEVAGVNFVDEFAVRIIRVLGQLQGIRKMVEQDRYCVDILIQLSSAVKGLSKVEDLVVMRQHLENCVAKALASGLEEW